MIKIRWLILIRKNTIGVVFNMWHSISRNSWWHIPTRSFMLFRQNFIFKRIWWMQFLLTTFEISVHGFIHFQWWNIALRIFAKIQYIRMNSGIQFLLNVHRLKPWWPIGVSLFEIITVVVCSVIKTQSWILNLNCTTFLNNISDIEITDVDQIGTKV